MKLMNSIVKWDSFKARTRECLINFAKSLKEITKQKNNNNYHKIMK